MSRLLVFQHNEILPICLKNTFKIPLNVGNYKELYLLLLNIKAVVNFEDRGGSNQSNPVTSPTISHHQRI